MQERIRELSNALDKMWMDSGLSHQDSAILTKYIVDVNCIEPDVDTYQNMIVLPNNTIDVSNILLLDQNFKPNLARFLNIFIRAENYNLLYVFFDRAFIHHVCGTIYVSRNANTFSMVERSFDRFVEAIKFTGYFEVEDILPMLLEIAKSQNNDMINKWRRPSLDYIAEIYRQNDGRYEDFIYQNYDRFGLYPFEILYSMDNKYAMELVLRLYVERSDIRGDLKDFLKLHYMDALQQIELISEHMPQGLYVELMLIFSHLRDVHPILINAYNTITSPELKRMILDKVDVPLEMAIKTLAQFNRACNRYTFDDNIVLGKPLSDYPILDTPAGVLIPNATQMLLNKYIQLCSPKASQELDYFKEYVGEITLENLCDVVLEQYIQCGTIDDEWAITMLVSNYSNTRMVDVIYTMFDALYQDRYKELEQFVRICIMVKKQELIEVLSELDKAKGQYLKISEVFLTYLAQINNMPKQEYELLVDKMVPTFGLDNNKILGCDTPEGMFCIVIKSGDLVEIEEPVDVKMSDLSTIKQTHILRVQKLLYRELNKQSRRLQEAFWDNRRWTLEDFEEIMIKNPIMNTLAQGVLWARYVGDNIISVFSVIDKDAFDIVKYKEVQSGNVEIGLFHPVESTTHNWKELFASSFVPFNQLDVEVFPIETFNKFSSVVSRFRGNIVNGENFEQKMLQRGWQHSLQSQQAVSGSFVLINSMLNMIAELEYMPFSTIENTGELSLGELRFYKLESAIRINKCWPTNKLEALNIGNIPRRFFSDVSLCSK